MEPATTITVLYSRKSLFFPAKMIIRPAIASDATQLSAIAFASKAHWGYSDSQMELWRDRVTISPDAIARNATWCAEVGGEVVGFCQVSLTPSEPHDCLEHLWVHPSHMRKGIGAALLHHAITASPRALLIHAEPESRAFYEREGGSSLAARR